MTEQAKKRSNKKPLVIGGGVIAVLCLFTVTYTLISTPERSVAAFCKVAKENKNSLMAGASNEQSLDVYRKLEPVAPNEIRSDIVTIKKGYEVITSDPSKAFDAGLGMSTSEQRRTDYINKNCTNF